MKIYRSSAGLIVIDLGQSIKKLNHDEGTPICIEQSGNYIYIREGDERIIGPVLYSAIFLSDGVTPAGANVAATVAYLETLLITNES